MSKAGGILGRILPLAAAFIPGIGPLASAALGAAGGALSGGGLKGALLGGLGGGLTGGLGSGIGSALGLGTRAAGMLGSGLGGAVSGLAGGGGLKSALLGGVSGVGSNLAGSALNGGLSLGGGSSYGDMGGSGAYGGGSSYSPEAGWIDWQPTDNNNLWESLTGGGISDNALGGLGKAGSTLLAGNQLLGAQDDSLAALKPYMQTGNLANKQLQGALKDGSLGGEFNPGDLTQDPGYQFRLQEGQKAMDRSLGARGNLFSGAALKASQEYGQGLADQTYNDAYQRFLQGQNSRAGILGGAAGRGQAAAGSAGQIYDNMGNIKANTTMGLNNTAQQYLSGSGYLDNDPNAALKRALGLA